MRKILFILTLVLSFIAYRKQQNPEAYKIIEDDTWMKKWNNDYLQIQPACESNVEENNIADTKNCLISKETEII